MLKKLLLTSALVAGFAASASADSALKVTLGGSMDSQLSHRHENGRFKHNALKADGSFETEWAADDYNMFHKRHSHLLSNDTKLNVSVDGKADMGLGYGAKIVLFADTSKAKEEYYGDTSERAMQTMAYVEGMFGRVEVGSHTGATSAMKVDATSFAAGTNGDAAYLWNPNTHGELKTKDAFLETANLPTNNLGTVGLKGANANKVTYYTPRYEGFMLGFSYTPDTEASGTVSAISGATKTLDASSRGALKDVFEAGVHYEGMYDQVGFKAAVLAQQAKAKVEKDASDGTTTKALKNVTAWEAGLNLSLQGFTVGGSYGSWGKSLRPTVDATHVYKNTNYWTAGAGYEAGPLAASLSYFASKAGFAHRIDPTTSNYASQNRLDSWTFGLNYKLAPGFMPYAEVTSFKFKDNHLKDGATGVRYASNKGLIVLAGTKLKF